MKGIHILLLTGLLTAGSASAQSIDDFDTGANPNGWWWNGFSPSMEITGGNPGGWYRDSFVNDFIPTLRSSTASGDWAGDYQATGVTTIEFDARTLLGPSGSQPMTIVLKDTKGTSSTSDDDYAYFVDNTVSMPATGAGWSHYSFDIPSQEAALPAGWASANGDWFSPGFSTGYKWPDLMASVDQVEVWMNDPTAFGIWLVWDVGLDNMEISVAPAGPSLAASGLAAGGTVTFTVTDATPGGNVLLGYSTTGAGPTVTPFGSVDLSAPIRSMPTLIADAAGVASMSATVPAGASGTTLYMQGVDMGTSDLTNAIAETVL